MNIAPHLTATFDADRGLVKPRTNSGRLFFARRGCFKPILRRLGLVLAVLALFSIAGGQWAVLQTVAWAGRRREDLLRAAGLTDVSSEWFHWSYKFADAQTWWEFVSKPGMFTRQFAELDEATREQVRSEIVASLADYRRIDGGYRIPHACRLWWGGK